MTDDPDAAGDAAAPTPPPAPRRLEAFVRGRVQGVGFRMYAFAAATRFGLSGWVANERDGVRCVAEGTPDELEALLEALREGPPAAEVDDVETSWSAATGSFDRFSLKSGWHGGD